jgi:hypothetical protein
MSAPSEDKAIMLERARLERFWLSSISPTDQAAWIARWLTRPPNDAHGRTYILGPRTTLQQTVRPPETIYAWSQIFGTYRFNRSPVSAPLSVTENPVFCTWSEADNDHVRLTGSPMVIPTPAWPLLVYVSPCLTPSKGISVVQTAFMCATFTVGSAQTIDLVHEWRARFKRIAGAPILAQTFTINENNELSQAWNLAVTTFT